MRIFAALVTVLALSFAAHAQDSFPVGPNLSVTPGELCQHPDSYRYPEHIPYCTRNVTTQTKNEVIHAYDVQFGYTIESMNRQDFKIDHFIPLCAGGGNDAANLWPQHKSVYAITDPLEPLICGLMAAGKLSQAQAVEYVHQAKEDLSKAPGIISMLQAQQ